MIQELKFKNFLSLCLITIIGIFLSVFSLYVTLPAFSIPLPLLIIATLVGFFGFSLVLYPKATAGQVIQLAISGIFINTLILSSALYAIQYFQLAEINLNSDFVLSTNPLIILVSFVFSVIALHYFINFEKIEKPQATSPKEEIKKEEAKEDTIKEETIKLETVSFSLEEEKTTEPVQEKEAEKKEEVQEYLFEKPETVEESTEDNDKEQEYNNLFSENKEETLTLTEPEMFSLEENSLKDEEENSLKNETLFIEEETPLEEFLELEDDTSKEDSTDKADKADKKEQTIDFIPTDIRLVKTAVSKKNDSKGKIASIGKLLVNNKAIEGIIDSNSMLEDSDSNNKTNIISSLSGEELYQKINKLKEESSFIKETALIDIGGFIKANNFEDKQKVQLIGAVVSGMYQTIQNYMTQISLSEPLKIFFETENENSFILKTNDEFLFSLCDKDTPMVNYNELQPVFDSEDIENIEISQFIDTTKLINFTLFDQERNILKEAGKIEESQNVSIIASALFENMSIFLKNIQLINLSKITIFNNETIFIIKNYGNENCAFITKPNDYVKVSEEFIKIEELY